MKVLFVSYLFPPLGGVASIRALKYVKYMAERGIEPIVLTVEPRFLRYPKDLALLRELPKGTRIFRVPSLDPEWVFKLLYGLRMGSVVNWLRNNIFVPDPAITWLAGARMMIDRIISMYPDIELAFVTAGPFSSLLLCKYLKAKHKLPYICEFRDEWTTNPERINIKYPAQSLNRERKWEAEAIKQADGIVYLTELMQQSFEQRYPFLKSVPHRVISNGFDDDDFSGFENAQPKPQSLEENERAGIFCMVYCGSFYDRRQPDRLWKALLNLIRSGKIDPDRISIEIYGKNTARFVYGAYIYEPLIRSTVQLLPFLTHKESIEKMLSADLLWIYIAGGTHTQSIQTGKIFDYIRSGKPVLAVVPRDGVAARILAGSGLGIIADVDEQQEIEDKLLEAYSLWLKGGLKEIKAKKDYVEQYNRKHLARSLGDLVQEVSKPSKLDSQSGSGMTEDSKSPKAILIKPGNSSFIRIDEEILGSEYNLKSISLNQSKGRLTYLFNILKAVIFILFSPATKKIFIWFADYHALPVCLLGKALGKQVVIFIGGMDAVCYPKLMMGVYTSLVRGFCARTSLRNCDLIIANHEALISSSNTYYNPKGHPEGIRNLIPNLKTATAVVYNAIHPIDNIDFVKDRGNSILSVGTTPRFMDVYNKGYDLVIEAARRNPQWQFKIVGIQERWLPELEKRFRVSRIGNLKLIPYLEQPELYSLYQNSQVYLQLSISEGMPNALMEAMLCGCIPIGSRVAGIVPLISNYGFLLGEPNLGTLATYIEKAMQMRDRYPISEYIKQEFYIEIRKRNLNRLHNP